MGLETLTPCTIDLFVVKIKQDKDVYSENPWCVETLNYIKVEMFDKS